MRRTLLFCLLGLLLGALSLRAQPDTLRLLCIGNSFSEDAVENNLHEIAAADGRVFIIGNMYIGGCPLEKHWKNATTDAPAYRYCKIGADGTKRYRKNTSLSYALADERWDVVTLQQASSYSGQKETFEPFLGNLVAYVRARIPDGARLMWHQTWAYATNSMHGAFPKYGDDQRQMYEAILSCSKYAVEKYGLGIVPCGTAIQNLRSSYDRENANRDGHHLNMTAGRYLAAATFYEALTGRDVTRNGWQPPHVPEFRRIVALRSAHEACLSPFAAVDLSKMGFGVAAPNYDEALVPQYTLPDALTCADGTPVRSSADWLKRRRPELLSLFEREMFGRAPGRPEKMHFKELYCDRNALGGLAVRKEVRVFFTDNEKKDYMTLLMYLPAKAKGKVPVFLMMNFKGNWGVSADKGILLPPRSELRARYGVVENVKRGAASSRWPLEMILKAGYGVVTFYRGDIDPDFDDGFRNGVQHLAYAKGQTYPKPDEWGTISAWAWGMRRALDYLETDPDVDGRRVAAVGHSRLGKTALWAGAQDERFAMVISNESGCGGAALSRRRVGETLDVICKHFPHWFCANFYKYMGNEDALPFDQHELLALVAPRPLYVASAEGDRWSDPRGEELSLQEARKVYALWGRKGLQKTGYHKRQGVHDVTPEDWRHYIEFADKYLK